MVALLTLAPLVSIHALAVFGPTMQGRGLGNESNSSGFIYDPLANFDLTNRKFKANGYRADSEISASAAPETRIHPANREFLTGRYPVSGSGNLEIMAEAEAPIANRGTSRIWIH